MSEEKKSVRADDLSRARVSRMITALSIVVPARDEEHFIPRCVAGLRISLGELEKVYPDVDSLVVFALDRCTDRSAELICDAGFAVIEPPRPGVGAARRAAAERALREFAGASPSNVWLASTDADSVVPRNWLTHQLQLAGTGADVVLGAVHPDPRELDRERRDAWCATHDAGQADGHVHGANLGIRGSAYLRAGGFESLYEHEDVDLVVRARTSGAVVAASAHHSVLTSGRLIGRTAGGYAGYLREQILPLAAQRAASASADRSRQGLPI